jgi:NADH:ubiquinone oxidoreductase subunit H
MAFHYVFNDYSGVEFNLLNYQKYTIKVLGPILLVKLSSLIKIYLGGWGRIAPLAPP